MSVFLDVILSMVQKSSSPLELGVVYPIICGVLAPSKRWLGMGFLPSTAFLRFFLVKPRYRSTKVEELQGRIDGFDASGCPGISWAVAI